MDACQVFAAYSFGVNTGPIESENSSRQRELYGASVAEIVAHITRYLGNNQSQVARTIGLSVPMLSHLVAARRAKIGNPSALARLQQLHLLAQQVADGAVTPGEVDARVAVIAETNFDIQDTTTQTMRSATRDSQVSVREMQDVFRATADAAEWLAIVTQLRESHPAAAELIYAYSVARTSEAVKHWEQTMRGTEH